MTCRTCANSTLAVFVLDTATANRMPEACRSPKFAHIAAAIIFWYGFQFLRSITLPFSPRLGCLIPELTIQGACILNRKIDGFRRLLNFLPMKSLQISCCIRKYRSEEYDCQCV